MPRTCSVTLAAALTICPLAPARAADPVPADRPAPDASAITLGLGVVPLSFDFADTSLGAVVSGGGDPTTLAGTVDGLGVALSLSREIGELGGVPLFVEVAGAFADADGLTSTSRRLPGVGSFALGSGTRTGDAIALQAASPGAATAISSATVTDPFGVSSSSFQSTFSPAGNNFTNNFAESGTTADGRGLAFVNVVTNGATPSAIAVGFTADAGGFLLAATGDLSGIEVNTISAQEVDYAELEARLIGAVPLGSSDWVVTPSIAPAYRYLRRDVDGRTDVLLPINPVTNARAAVSVLAADDLTAHYAGGSLGIGAVGPVPGDLIVSVGAGAGLLGMFADYEGTSSATVFGIDTTTVAFDPVSDELDELAYFARASVGVTKQLGGFSLSFGGQAEYLSDVPTVVRDSGVALGAPGAFAASGGSGSVRLETDDAVILSGSLSVSVTF